MSAWGDRLEEVKAKEEESSLPVGFAISFISLLGLAGNIITIVIYGESPILRRSYFFTLNLSIIELIASGSYWFIAISAFSGVPQKVGSVGCNVDGFSVGFSALSAVGLKVLIAAERFRLTKKSCSSTKWRMKSKFAFVMLIYLAAFSLSFLPIVGWSKYVPVGRGWYCCFEFNSRDAEHTSFFMFLFFLGFLTPLVAIIYCYGRIFILLFLTRQSVTHRSSQMGSSASLSHVAQNGNSGCNGDTRMTYTSSFLRSFPNGDSDSPQNGRRHNGDTTLQPLNSQIVSADIQRTFENEKKRVLKMCCLICIIFVGSWIPYASVAFLSQFAPQSFKVSGTTMDVVSLLAKLFVVYNPIIYGVCDKPFRQRFSVLRERIVHGSIYTGAEEDEDDVLANV